jgi:hypothetical protein
MKTMKKIIQIFLMVIITSGVIIAQPRAKIVLAPVTTPMVSQPPFNTDSSVFVGIGNVPNHTYAYMYVWNWGDNTPITSASWIFNAKPAGSNATITPFQYNGQNWAKFLADTTGTFTVKVTMVAGTSSKDTIINIVSGNFVGTGGFYGVPPVYPNCMTCHQGIQPFQDIFDRWKVSQHANIFRYNIDSAASYSTSCMKCHTTGYNHNLTVNNHGFNNVALQVGWSWSFWGPPKPGNWDSLRTKFPTLVPFASIGCENCHGVGSEHASSGDSTKIQRDYSGAACISCHDAPTHHIKPFQWKQSKHAVSNLIYTSAWAQTISSPDFGTNDLGNCIRCHDPQGYVNFTKGKGTNTTGWTLAQTYTINCVACHDAHGNSNFSYLRNRPTNSDTLANGYHYAGGNGKVCMDCHKARPNAVTYVLTRVTSSHWGPHSGPQADILNGQNAATFNGPYITGSHKNIQNTCVTCHMAPTADTGTAYTNRVGEHTFRMVDSTGSYDDVKGCLGCHPGVTRFSDFMAPEDYAGLGHLDTWQNQIAGCIENLARALPHTGVDTVSWQLIAADSLSPNYLNIKKAYWNYQLVVNDRSKGLHNPFFVVQVLLSSIAAAPIGIKPISNEIPNRFELAQNFPNPFNPTTTIKFSIAKTGNVSIKIYDLTGRLVKTLVNQNMTPGKYDIKWTSMNDNNQFVASGVYFYRIETSEFTDTKKMVLVK